MRKISQNKTHTESLSHTQIPKVVTPPYKNWGAILQWTLMENVPGEFPYAAGIYPFKREGEDPTRMFAGEGGPERTNRRFHYVSKGMPAARLSTAFDSVTLYGNDPDWRPDIYGKIGNSGVSICCLDDAKKLYSGFNLSDPTTSVSMTINGPAPMLLLDFLWMLPLISNVNCTFNRMVWWKKWIKRLNRSTKRKECCACLPGSVAWWKQRIGFDAPWCYRRSGVAERSICENKVRYIKDSTWYSSGGYFEGRSGTEHLYLQHWIRFADDGWYSKYFIDHKVRIFTVYQSADTTLRKQEQIRFHNWHLRWQMDLLMWNITSAEECTLMILRRTFLSSSAMELILNTRWSEEWREESGLKAMKLKYGGNERSQMLKYHIQTSGRSLHAQRSTSMIFVPHCRHCTRFMIIVIHCIQMLTMKPSQHRRKKVYAVRWPFSWSSTRNSDWRKMKTLCRDHLSMKNWLIL